MVKFGSLTVNNCELFLTRLTLWNPKVLQIVFNDGGPEREAGSLMERTEVAWRDRVEDFSPCGGCMVLRRN